MTARSASRAIAQQSRRLHVISTGTTSSNASKGISNKQSQYRYVASLLLDTSSNIKTAKDVQFLLNNLGISTRASMNQIEFLMEKASNKNSQHLTASDLIDLIARVRSV
ncbi:hypothetical protein ACHAWT_000844 [Skeletonema menzelii]|eukprot:scaffold1185_cov143-Skeletonema_menzelii.AAC.26